MGDFKSLLLFAYALILNLMIGKKKPSMQIAKANIK